MEENVVVKELLVEAPVVRQQTAEENVVVEEPQNEVLVVKV